MLFKKIEQFGNLEMSYISDFSGGYISKNPSILQNLKLTKFTQFLLEKCVYGTPVFKLGNGDVKLLILSGIHGNELPPQIANVKLLNNLLFKDLNSTIYFIPFAAPKSTMNNERRFNGADLNRFAHIKNSISNMIVENAVKWGVDFVGDFHSTAYNSNPGMEAVFSSKSPSPESYLLANYISKTMNSQIISFDYAGSSYNGAVEDVCNLKRIPAVTCEVLSPFGSVAEGSVEKSYAQMCSFLTYFGV